MYKLFKQFALLLQQHFIQFDPVVKREIDETILERQPPIFLIGAPRTGSTAFIQVLYKSLQVSYISNIMALLPVYMVRMTRRYPQVATRYTGDVYKSTYGFIPGLRSPNEAGKIMRYWFDRHAESVEASYIRKTVADISVSTGAPVFFKNQTNTVRLDIIRKVLSESCYIFLRRDILHTAQSILLTRRDLYGNDKVWWSVTPPGYEKVLDQDVYYQVVWQVMRLEQIAETACKENPERSLIIDYEVFCDNPYATLTQIQQQFNLNWRGGASELKPLTAANRVRISSEEWSRLEDAYQRVMADLSFIRQTH